MEYPPQIGGIATYTQNQAKYFDPNDVVILAPKSHNKKQLKLYDKKNFFPVIRKNFLYPIFIWPRWIRLFWQVLFILRKEAIDVIYIHHILPVGYVACMIKKIKKIPFVIFSHGTDIQMLNKSKWKNYWVKKIIKNSDKIVFNSKNLKKKFLRFFSEFEDKTLVIYPEPDQIFFQPISEVKISKARNKFALNGKKVLLSVSRLADGKGFPHMLRIMKKILTEEANVVWLIVGDGPKRKYLQKEVQKNNLQNVVRFVGPVEHHNLPLFYNLADLFVLLTHPDEGREEGLGLVFLEAGACKLPVIAGKSGGVEEAVIHSQTGVVVDIYRGDKIVANSIIEMLKNPDYAKRLAQNAYDRIKIDFNLKKQMEKINWN